MSARRAFERIAAREGVTEITADKKAGISQSGFYKMMLGAGADDLVAEIRAGAREAGRPDAALTVTR